MKRSRVLAGFLPLIPYILGQRPHALVTVTVGRCHAHPSSSASLSTALLKSPSNTFNSGSVTVARSQSISTVFETSNNADAAPVTPVVSEGQPSASFGIPASSARKLVDRYGQTYDIAANARPVGTIVLPRLMRKKQLASEADKIALEDCVASCSLTPQCQAAFYMGSTCLLYASMSGTTSILGGEAAFNLARFTGFTNASTSEILSQESSSSIAPGPTVSFGTTAFFTPRTTPIVPVSIDESQQPSISWPATSATSWFVSGSDTSASQPSAILPSMASLSPIQATGTSSSAMGLDLPILPSSPSDQLIASMALPFPQSFLLTVVFSSSEPASKFPSAPASLAFPTSPPPLHNSVEPMYSPAQFSSSPSAIISVESASPAHPPIQHSSSSSTPSLAQFTSRVISPTTAVMWSTSSPGLSSLFSTTSLPISTSGFSSFASIAPYPFNPASIANPVSTPTFFCPADSGDTIKDANGIRYNMMCDSAIDGENVGEESAASVGNGAETGAGNCSLKQGSVGFHIGPANMIAAIRVGVESAATSSRQSSSSLKQSSTRNSAASVIVSTISSGRTTPPRPNLSATLQAGSLSSHLEGSASSFGWLTESSNTRATLTGSTVKSTTSPFVSLAVSSSISTMSATTRTILSSSDSGSAILSGASPTASASNVSVLSTLTPSSSTNTSLAAPSTVPNTGKRGLSYTNGSYTLPYSFAGQDSPVSWGYDWNYSPYTDSQNILHPEMTYIPLLFNDVEELAQAWPAAAQAAIDKGADALMAFNEPDLCYSGSACMSVSQSVAAYNRSMMPFAGQARLGAPAVSNGGYPSGLTYLNWFMGNCTACRVDFINLHWYSSVSSFSYLQSHVQLAYEQFGLPIWITEFGYDSSGATDAEAQTFLKQVLPWLDAVPYVEKYAYFLDAPGYLLTAEGDGLSEQGKIYNSYTAPCANWNNSEGHC